LIILIIFYTRNFIKKNIWLNNKKRNPKKEVFKEEERDLNKEEVKSGPQLPNLEDSLNMKKLLL